VSGIELYLRLAGATAIVLLPGALVARALGRGGASGTLAWGLTLVFGGLLLVFALSSALAPAFVVLAVGGVVALPFALRRGRPDRAAAVVFASGTAFGWLLWRFLPPVRGDAVFHLGRVRKLLELDDLSPLRVSELAGGGLHPGYAFPLWHGFLALVSRVAHVDPALVVTHEAAVLAPLAFLVVYEAGERLFVSRWLGGATLVAALGLTAFASGSGGAFRLLSLPATAGGRQLLVPAALALFFAYVRDRSRGGLACVAAAGIALAIVHPTYALFVLLLVAGFLVVRLAVARSELVPIAAGFAALAIPAALFVVWLLPTVRETSAHSPTRSALASSRERYTGQVVYESTHRYRLSAGVVTRAGTVPIAALSAVPLAFFALRRRWAAFVLGSTLACLAVLLIPWVFPLFSDAVSLSQSRRLAGFIPFAFALAGGAAVLARLIGLGVVPLALAAGVLLQRHYPGDFGYFLRTGGPVLPVWIAVVGGTAALVLGLRYRRALERAGPLAFAAVALFVVPTAIATSDWDKPPPPEDELSPALIEALKQEAAPGDIVFSDPETSYRLTAYVPVYVAVSAPAHTADTKTNRPYERVRDAQRFFRTGDLSIPRRYRSDWIVVDRRRHPRTRLGLRHVFSDGRYEVFRLRSK
jgi:hypothetical protein